MKAINDHKSTHSFCIGAIEAADMPSIVKHFGERLIAVAREKDDPMHHYTVRTSWSEDDGIHIVDHYLKTERLGRGTVIVYLDALHIMRGG
jgi:hypothetical protein